eukprot:m.18883 g.18883  ORF g.18883 m.18883 type:complete len:89 (+) comp9772_c0_seq1:97-363(+)
MSAFSGKGTFLSMMKQHPEIVPVVVTGAIGMMGAAYYIGRLCTRPDVVWSGRQDMPWTRVTQNTNLHFTPFSGFKGKNETEDDLRGRL